MFIHNRKKRVVLYLINLFVEFVNLPGKLFGGKRQPVADAARILLVRLDHIGDLVMTSPSFSLVRRQFPNAEITLLCSSAGKQLYETDSRIDKIEVFNWPWKQQPVSVGFDRKKVFELVRMIRKLRAQQFDIFIDFRGDFRFILFFGVMTGAKCRISNSRSGDSSLLHMISPYSVDEHEVERSVKVVRTVSELPIELRPSLQLKTVDMDSVRAKISHQTTILPTDQIAIIGPYSSRDVKSWPSSYFREVIAHLLGRDFKIIVVGAPGDKEDSEKLIHGFGENVFTFAGLTTVRELAALMSMSSLVVGVDTGVLHLASCFDVKIIALFGSTRTIEFRPYSPLATILDSKECTCNQFLHLKCDSPVEGYAKCLSSLKPQTVIQAIEQAMPAVPLVLEESAAVSA